MISFGILYGSNLFRSRLIFLWAFSGFEICCCRCGDGSEFVLISIFVVSEIEESNTTGGSKKATSSFVTWVNFINVLPTAFKHEYPESAKKSHADILFTLSGSSWIKASLKHVGEIWNRSDNFVAKMKLDEYRLQYCNYNQSQLIYSIKIANNVTLTTRWWTSVRSVPSPFSIS